MSSSSRRRPSGLLALSARPLAAAVPADRADLDPGVADVRALPPEPLPGIPPASAPTLDQTHTPVPRTRILPGALPPTADPRAPVRAAGTGSDTASQPGTGDAAPAASEPGTVGRASRSVFAGHVPTEELEDRLIDVDRIAPDPEQPRQWNPEDTVGYAEFQESIAALAQSIASQGLIEAIEVRPAPPGLCRPDGAPVDYLINYGERRFLAHQHLGRRQIRAKVRRVSEVDLRLRQYAENNEREDLTPMQRARELDRLRWVLARKADPAATQPLDWKDLVGHPDLSGESGHFVLTVCSRLTTLPAVTQQRLLNRMRPEGSVVVSALRRLRVGVDDTAIDRAVCDLLRRYAGRGEEVLASNRERTEAARAARAAKLKGEALPDFAGEASLTRPAYRARVTVYLPKGGEGGSPAARRKAQFYVLKALRDQLDARVHDEAQALGLSAG